MTPSTESADWPELIRGGRWAALNGLPRDLTEQQLLDALGKAHVVSHVRAAHLSGQPVTLVESDLLRYWLDDQHLVLLVEIHEPATLLPVDGLLTTMGPADREGAGRYRRYGAMTTEYVYANRGLALTVAESFDEPPTFEPFLAAVHLFVATDMADFIGRLGGADHLGPQLAG